MINNFMEKGGIIKYNKDNSSKTGTWRYIRPEVNAAKCLGCGTCVPHCPEAVMELRKRLSEEIELSSEIGKKKEIVDIDFEYCKGCGVCATVCPTKAILMKK